MGCTGVVVAGMRRLGLRGAFGTNKHTQFRFCDTLEEAIEFLHSRGVTVYGVEIAETAEPITRVQWARSAAFMMGNEVGFASNPEVD